MKIHHIIRSAALLGCLALILPASAQPIADIDQPAANAADGTPEPVIVDPMAQARDAMARNDPAEALARYLRVLARDPGDLEALSGAGGAALAVGDADAAINFYVRAEKIAPRDGRIKAGLGSALVQKEQPRAALRLFDSATDLGVSPIDIALDRGLAYDLRGDNKKAQQDYLLLLRARPNSEATRRLALSLAMAGDRAGAIAVLDPLLRKQDIPAWRARAFVLAMTGDAAGAEQAAFAVLPRYQATALKPFLERLPQLKPAEKAAAVHFGHFPEDKAPVMVDATPAGPPKGNLPVLIEIPAAIASAAAPATGQTVLADNSAAADKAARERDIRSLAQDRRAAERKAAAEKAAIEKKAKAEKAAADKKAKAKEALAENKKSRSDGKSRDDSKGKDDGKSARASGGERYWVQVSSGSYKPDLGKEWAKQKSKHAKQLAGKTAWTTPYKSTNRLLIGPFASHDAAQDYVNDVRLQGFATYPVTTPASQKVEKLD